jgi:hypothetical protein
MPAHFENVSMVEFDKGGRSPDVVIRILDTIKEDDLNHIDNLHFSENPYPDALEFQFRFDDTTDPDNAHAIQPEQAQELFNLLSNCITLEWNVLIHCVMGKCRAGAITHAAEALGQFLGLPVTITDHGAIPNVLVKSMILRYIYSQAKNFD